MLPTGRTVPMKPDPDSRAADVPTSDPRRGMDDTRGPAVALELPMECLQCCFPVRSDDLEQGPGGARRPSLLRFPVLQGPQVHADELFELGMT